MLKGFTTNILIRVFLMALLMAALGYFLFRTDFYISAAMVLLMMIFLVWDLIRYTNQTNRDITTFLTGIKYDDFALRFSGDHKGRSFKQMYESFNQINSKFLEIRAEKEAQFLYLQNIVESAEVGLLCVDQDGEVILINRELKKLLGKPYLISFDFLSRINKELYKGLLTMENGDRKLLRININNQLLQLSVQARKFKIKEDLFSLFSIQNIQTELEVQEVRSWQKLIRILTHEIMNSVTPIISLSAAVHDKLGEEDLQLQAADIRRNGHGHQRHSKAQRGAAALHRHLPQTDQGPPPRPAGSRPLPTHRTHTDAFQARVKIRGHSFRGTAFKGPDPAAGGSQVAGTGADQSSEERDRCVRRARGPGHPAFLCQGHQRQDQDPAGR